MFLTFFLYKHTCYPKETWLQPNSYRMSLPHLMTMIYVCVHECICLHMKYYTAMAYTHAPCVLTHTLQMHTYAHHNGKDKSWSQAEKSWNAQMNPTHYCQNNSKNQHGWFSFRWWLLDRHSRQRARLPSYHRFL